MIYSLTGTLRDVSGSEVVIECAGVGYLVRVPGNVLGKLPAVGSSTTLFTIMNVSDNDVSLFGFADRTGREMFQMLTTVSGVGPKVGLAILSALTPENIVLAVSSGDHKAFTAASGVGPKLGQRLVLELKDKVAKGFAEGGLSMQDVQMAAGPGGHGPSQQAIAALVSLGYTQGEAASAVAKIDPGMPVPEIIRLALQGMAKGR